MNINEYQTKSLRTINIRNEKENNVISNLCMGLAGESGELIDHFKKHYHQKHPLNILEVIEEMGDVMFYLVNIANLYGFTMAEVLEHNIKKLEKRYPDGFDADKSINR